MVMVVFSQLIVEVGVSKRPMREDDGSCCAVCPALIFPAGAFDVIDRPGPQYPYNRDLDCRVNAATGAPTCVHPFRIELPAAPYASEGLPVPVAAVPVAPSAAALELPEFAVDLEGWLVARIKAAGTSAAARARAVAEAEAAAGQQFPGLDVVAALRRVFAHHLVG
jgi:hypothetical protein